MKESVPPSSLGMCCAGIKAASSSRVFVKWILEATTGSSQPFIMFQRQTWVIILFRRGVEEEEGNTLEDPGRSMDEDHAEGFGIVCFEAFDHKFNRTVILFD